MKYQAKPIIIEAIQFTGNNLDEIKKYLRDYLKCKYEVIKDYLIKDRFVVIFTVVSDEIEPTYFKEGDYLLFCDCSGVIVLDSSAFKKKYKKCEAV